MLSSNSWRWVFIFLAVAFAAALSIFALKATGYNGLWWIAVGVPAALFLKLISFGPPAPGENALNFVSSVLYGLLAAVWFMPLQGKWKFAVRGVVVPFFVLVLFMAMFFLTFAGPYL